VPRKYKIVILRGDGVSREVVPEAVKTLKAAQEVVTGLELDFVEFECGFEYYKKTGDPWPSHAYETCKESDAILYGAVGLPGVESLEHIVYVHRILRQNLDLYANVRPVKLRENVPCPLVGKKPGDIDFVIVRENTEDLYAPMRGVLTRAEVAEVAIDVKIVTRKGAERIIKYAFELCRRRGKAAPLDGKLRVTCVDKSTVLKSCALFREVYNEVAGGYSDIAEVGDKHGMFRPIHGSAPKYSGKYVTNPLATILSAAMLMDWLADKRDDKSAKEAANRIEKAVDLTLKEGKVLPRDLGGSSKTNAVGDEIAKKIRTL